MQHSAYLNSRVNAWAPTTMRSERARLNQIHLLVEAGDPAALWQHLQSAAKPYSRVTAWTRAIEYYEWLIEQKLAPSNDNVFKQFRKENARLFRHSYQRRAPSQEFNFVLSEIKSKLSAEVRSAALAILTRGLRWSELSTLKTERVLGKGAKPRRVFPLPAAQEGEVGFVLHPASPVSYTKLRAELKKHLGLTPHDLRKIYANELLRRGATVFQLLKAMGWSNVTTAQSYIEARDSDLEALIEKQVP